MGVNRAGTRLGRSDAGVSAVLGGILMIALMMTLVPGAVLLRQAMSDEMQAQREAAERAAFCARHPNSKAMDCKTGGPMPGYRCEEATTDVFVCVPEEIEAVPTVVTVPPGLLEPPASGEDEEEGTDPLQDAAPSPSPTLEPPGPLHS